MQLNQQNNSSARCPTSRCRTPWSRGGIGRLLAAACIVLPVSALPSLAQQEPEEDSPPSVGSPTAPVVYETASVTARSVEDAPVAITVMSGKDLEQRGLRDVAEAIALVPGIRVEDGAARGGLQAARVRGGDPNFVQVLLDGVLLNDSTDSLGGAFPLGTLALFDVEQIEVVRGAASSVYGSGGLSGALQVKTSLPRGRRFRAFSTVGGEDSWSSGLAFGLGTNQELERNSYLDGSFLHQRDDKRIAADLFEQDAATLRAGFLGSRHQSQISLRWSDWDSADYAEGSGGPVLGAGALRLSDHREASAAWSWEGAWRSRGALARLTYAEHDLGRFTPAIVPVVPAVVDGTGFDDLRLWSSVSLDRGRWGQLHLGASVQRERGTNSGALLLQPVLGFDLPTSYTIDREQEAALVDWSASGELWTVQAGLRADVHDEGEEVSPRLALGLGLGSWGRLEVATSRGFKLPSLYALASPAAVGGNPGLEPETAEHAEVGLSSGTRAAFLKYDLRLFRATYSNLIDFDFSSFQLVNRARVRAEGLELSLGMEIGGWQVELAATSQDVRDRANDAELRLRARSHGTLSVFGEVGSDWRVGADARWVSSRLDQLATEPSARRLAGYVLPAVFATWDRQERWQVALRLANVTDERYETHLGIRAAGREYRATLRYRWN